MHSSQNIPTGPGSRGGMYHDPDWRRAYYRAWRRAHPENARDNVAAAKRLAWYGTTETSVVRAVG